MEVVTCEACVERKQWSEGKKEMYEVCLFGFFDGKCWSYIFLKHCFVYIYMHMGEINISSINDDNNYSTYMTEKDVKK
jgi:hypothetical protein